MGFFLSVTESRPFPTICLANSLGYFYNLLSGCNGHYSACCSGDREMGKREKRIWKAGPFQRGEPPIRESYRIISHTADLGMEVQGNDLKDLFAQAGRAFFDLMIGLGCIKTKKEERIGVSAPDTEALLVAWLSELLFLFETRRLVFSDFNICRLNPESLEAVGLGETYDPQKHPVRQVFKAVTYHQLALWEEKGVWKARVVFDL